MIVWFENFSNVNDFISEIRHKSAANNKLNYANNDDIAARLIEFYDSTSLNFLREDYPQIPSGAKYGI